MANYSERKKSDREKMASIIESVITDCGATFEREEGEDYPGPRCIQLRVKAARGLCVTIEFDGDNPQPGIFCLPWHMSTETDACLSDAFQGSVNPHHFRKSTVFAEGFVSLRAMLTAGLIAARDGWAFDADREAAAIAKDGTAADRNARFAKWREEWEAERSAADASGEDGNPFHPESPEGRAFDRGDIDLAS